MRQRGSIISAIIALSCTLVLAARNSRNDFGTVEQTMRGEFVVRGVAYTFPSNRVVWGYNPTYNNYAEWPWQFARFAFIEPLANRWAANHEPEVLAKYQDLIGGFIDQCPPVSPMEGPYKDGPQHAWRTLDTGIRASCWSRSWETVKNAPGIRPGFRDKFIASLRDHVARLTPKKTSNNWRIMELCGLVNTLLEFPELDPDGAILRQAEGEFAAMIDEQLYPDGFQFELTPGYHWTLPRDYSAVAERYRHYGRTPPEFLEKGIERSFEIYTHLARPDRRLPQINDSGVSSAPGALEKAVKLYPERADYLWMASKGKKGREPDFLSYAFPYAGAIVFRDSWREDAVWGYLDASPFGRSHQHEDKLNFLLFAYGKEMICEGGIYAYDTSEMRKYVISTRAHNTIRIDGCDQNTRKGYRWEPWMIHKKAEFEFSTTPVRDIACAVYTNGYGFKAECQTNVVHSRMVEFIKEGGAPYFVVTDTLTASDAAEHTYEQLWHLETCSLDLKPTAFTADFGDGVRLSAEFTSENGKLVDMMGQKEPYYMGWMPISPPGPHEHRPIHTPVLRGTFRGKTVVSAVFRPSR